MNPRTLTKAELVELIEAYSGEPDLSAWPYSEAREQRRRYYGNSVFLRGLIELSSYCRQDCYYCGLRKSNRSARRYRLTGEQIFACCAQGYALGFRTFVLQGGEDAAMTDAFFCELIEKIKCRFPDCAVTLSLGERSTDSYRALYSAGADRYLLRHETATDSHFASLHPPAQTLESRKRCLYALREIGFQTGAGLMVGSPGQTTAHLAEDLLFLRELRPQMVGIGPFLPHRDTPLAAEPAGTVSATLLMLALTRLILPDALLPATTALSSLAPNGRGLGLLAGANVVMPNLSPPDVRDAYSIYDGKAHSGAEAGEGLATLRRCIAEARMAPDFSRGDYVGATSVRH